MTENTEEPLDANDDHSVAESLIPDSASDSSDLVDDSRADGPADEVRVGSPFAVDPTVPEAPRRIEPFYDVGPIRYTAMGAVAASVMVLAFAAIAAWWFPSGGALIAALGCVLSIFGMYSTFRITSVSLLAVHLVLFVVSYGRSIG